MKIQLNTFKPINNYTRAFSQKQEKATAIFCMPNNIKSEHIRANFMPVSFGSNEEASDEYKTGFEGDVEPIDIDIVGPFEEEEDINFYDFVEAMEEITGSSPEVKEGNSVPYNINIEPTTIVNGELNIVHDSNSMPARLKVMNFKAPYVDFKRNLNVRMADFKNFQMNELNGINLHFADVRFIPEFTDEKSHNSFKEGARFDSVSVAGEISFYNSSFAEMTLDNCKAETLRMEKAPAAYDLLVKDSEFDNLDFMHVDFKSAPVFHNVKLTGGVYHHSENFGGSSFEQCYFEEGADFSGLDPNYLKNGMLSNCGYKDGTEDDFILPKGVEFEDLLLYPQELFFDTFNPEFQDVQIVFEEEKPLVATQDFKDWQKDSLFFIEDESMNDNTEIVEKTPMETVFNQANQEEAKKLASEYYILGEGKGSLIQSFPRYYNPDLRVN